MESNRTFLFFSFGISLLPLIYSDIFPSLFIMKEPDSFYVVADEFQDFEGKNTNFKFYTPLGYELYYACPEQNAPFFPKYALKVKSSVPAFHATRLEHFIKGIFSGYNCDNPIKPVALKAKQTFKNKSVFEFDIGFLIHENNIDFRDLSNLYEDLPKKREYDFIAFLTIKMNDSSGTIMSVRHQIISRGLLEADSALVFTQPYETNLDIYGFDIESLYSEANQERIFFSIFGVPYAEYYNPPKQILRKVQLAPQEDFLLNTWKLSSFVDLNTAAMWEQVHHQWRNIEIFVRKVARELPALNIETGTAEVLSLGVKPKPVYLRKWKKSPVPNYFWKLVKFEEFDDPVYIQAVLIIMHNDPYTPDQKPICDDVGKSLGWMVSNNNHETGLTYVCPVVRSVTNKLHVEYNEKYEVFNLKKVFRFKYNVEKGGEFEFSFEDIFSKIVSPS